jgi:hypothetical protein
MSALTVAVKLAGSSMASRLTVLKPVSVKVDQGRTRGFHGDTRQHRT